MANKRAELTLALPVLEQFPFLFYGFGLKGWGVKNLQMRREGFRVVSLRQIHSDRVVAVEDVPVSPPQADGVVTDRPFLFLTVKTADCLPLLLADPEKRAVAAVHCGWRGTAARLAEKTVHALVERYGSDPAVLRAALGPCIGAHCYEVGEDVRRAFRESGLPLRVFRGRRGRPGKYFFDLAAANVLQLKRAGLREKHIDRIGLCTHCRPDLCSYRRDPHQPGRTINFIGFKSSG